MCGLKAELAERLQAALEAEEPDDERELEADDEPGRPGHTRTQGLGHSRQLGPQWACPA